MSASPKLEVYSNDASNEIIDVIPLTRDSLTVQYIKEKEKIIAEHGSLQEMRLKLGMSKSKIANMLLVKPSTWSRWEKNPEKAPPYIFQSVKWFLMLSTNSSDMRTSTIPEFLYENQLKVIGGELKKIKTDFDYKTKLMNALEDKIANIITEGFSQIQFNAPAAQTSGIDESFKNDQYKIQSKVENVEFLIRQMREDVSTIKSREPFYQVPIQQQKPIATFQQSQISNGEQVNAAAIALKVILGFLGVGALVALTYLFVMYG